MDLNIESPNNLGSQCRQTDCLQAILNEFPSCLFIKYPKTEITLKTDDKYAYTKKSGTVATVPEEIKMLSSLPC